MFLEGTLMFHGVSNFRLLQPSNHDFIPDQSTYRFLIRQTNTETQKHSLWQHLKRFQDYVVTLHRMRVQYASNYLRCAPIFGKAKGSNVKMKTTRRLFGSRAQNFNAFRVQARVFNKSIPPNSCQNFNCSLTIQFV